MMTMGKLNFPRDFDSNLFFLCAEKTSQRSQKAKNFLVLSSPVFRARVLLFQRNRNTTRANDAEEQKEKKSDDDDADLRVYDGFVLWKIKKTRGKSSKRGGKSNTFLKTLNYSFSSKKKKGKEKKTQISSKHTHTTRERVKLSFSRKRKDAHLKHTRNALSRLRRRRR